MKIKLQGWVIVLSSKLSEEEEESKANKIKLIIKSRG